jgi:hypothetical protein
LVAAPVFGALVYLRGDSGAGSTDREPSRLEANPVEVAPAAGERSRSAQTPPTRKRERQPPAPPATPVGLVLTATLGDSWVDARRGSVAGPILFQGTLTSGRTVRFSGRRLWVRLGAASNLAFTLNGKHVDPGLLGTVDVVVTPKGIRPAY